MFHILSLLFWLVIIPFCIGLIPANFISEDKRNPGFVLLAGYFVMWAVFEVVTIPAVLWVVYDNFKVVSVHGFPFVLQKIIKFSIRVKSLDFRV